MVVIVSPADELLDGAEAHVTRHRLRTLGAAQLGVLEAAAARGKQSVTTAARSLYTQTLCKNSATTIRNIAIVYAASRS
eukprot:2756690-Pleurochrysis_carterae.AAC.2